VHHHILERRDGVADPLESMNAAGIWAAGRSSQSRTERDHAEVTGLWLRGIALLGGNVASVDRWSAEAERDHVLLALLTHAANTQLSGYQLATAGYCTQAQALIRLCEEDWVAFLYVLNFPHQAGRFLDFGPGTQGTPRFNDMVQALEAKLQVSMYATRETIKWLHQLAHVDRMSVRGSYEVLPAADAASSAAHFRMGPHYDAEDFVNCAGQFIVTLQQLLKESEGLCLIIGVPAAHPNAFDEYRALVTPWLAQLEQGGASDQG
jgi:hypothetical protein